MNVFVLSHRCGHCVHRQVALSDDEYEASWRGCVGKPCPVCGVRPEESDLEIILLKDDVQARKDGLLPWGEANQPHANFAAFKTTSAPETVRGEMAKTLRDRMYGDASRKRKEEYTALSKAFASISGLQFGMEAEKAGNYERAVMWLKSGAENATDPDAAAGCYLYLGLTQQKLGNLAKARDAFRSVLGYSSAPATIRWAAGDQLGNVLKQLGDHAGARKAYQAVLDSRDPAFSAKAALNLGTLEDEVGNHERAKSLWEYAHKHAKRQDSVKGTAAYNLGWYWETHGDPDKARPFYEFAVASNCGEATTRAAGRLRGLPKRRRGLFGRRG